MLLLSVFLSAMLTEGFRESRLEITARIYKAPRVIKMAKEIGAQFGIFFILDDFNADERDLVSIKCRLQTGSIKMQTAYFVL